MKPSELFPGAVCAWDGKPFIVQAINVSFYGEQTGIIGLSGTDKITCFIEGLEPLPISPAVMMGLGFEKVENNYTNGLVKVQYNEYEWQLIGDYTFAHAHSLQGACIHLYGVELTWNQSEYDKAIKEEAKP